MKEIFKITVSLTGVCIAAAIVLGAVFTQTEHARKEIEEKQKEQTIRELLGFEPGSKPPEDLKVYSVHRYVISHPDKGTILGYVAPREGEGFTLVMVDLGGKPVGEPIEIEAETAEMGEQAARDPIVRKALPDGSSAHYAETFYVADRGGKRLGYVLPGVTQGFKTFIKLMVSLNPDFSITGIAITESEEDPGLGAEIEQSYFRNQFVGKTLDVLKDLKVVKEPIPVDYMPVLEPKKYPKVSPEERVEIRTKHLEDNIYALTGATISSKAVTKGVKDTVRKFVYRFDILKKAIEQENAKVAF